MTTRIDQTLPEWAAKTVAEDQRRGKALLSAADRAVNAGPVPSTAHKISDSPAQRSMDAVRARDSEAAHAAARSLSRARPFFKRITIRDNDGERSICISDVRTTQSIGAHLESDFEVFGWTSPAAPLVAAEVGALVDGRYATSFGGRVVARAHYRHQLLHTASDATLESGNFISRIARRAEAPNSHLSPSQTKSMDRTNHADDRRATAPASDDGAVALPHFQIPERQMPRSLGSLNIAATADQMQWLSFHHDPKRSLLVEGPPGSGKTSVALMRIPCLIDRQWAELGLKAGRDDAFYTEERTVVVIPRPNLKHALSLLAETVEVPSVRYSTAETLSVEVLRNSPFGGVILSETFDAEVDLMRHRRLSALLRYFLGRRALAVAEGLIWSAAAQLCPRARVKDLESRLINWATALPNVGRARTFSSICCDWFAAGRDQPAKVIYADRCLLQWTCREIFDRKAILQNALEDPLDAKSLALIDLAGARPLITRWRKEHPSDLTATSQGECYSLAAMACDVWSRDVRSIVPTFLRATPSPTHIVVDEVQDFSDEALTFLQAYLEENGVITVAGDRMQAQRASGSSGMWGGLAVSEFDHISLDVNYRQSLEVGGFVSRAHTRLFGTSPTWAVGPRSSGATVRVCSSSPSSAEQLARVAFTEVKALQGWSPQCTVAVIHLGGAEFSSRLSQSLRILGLRAHTLDSADAEWENQLLLVSTAESCKGLEFDATVVVDLANSGRIDSDLWDSAKRELFVALSRACDRMTVIAGNGASGRLLRACAD